MVLRVNDPDKLYPQGTMKAAKDAEARFRAPVSKPAPTKMMQNRTSPGLGPQRVASRVEAPEKPELISYETNPNMDWRTAQAINEARVKGYQQRLGNVQEAQSSLDTSFQSGQNQMGVQGLSNRGAMNRTVRTGQDAMARTQVGERGATNRLGIANQFTEDEAARAHTRELERLGVSHDYGMEATRYNAAKEGWLSGIEGNDATDMANKPYSNFVGAVPQKKSGTSKFIPGKISNTPGQGYRYDQYPMTAGPDGKATQDWDSIPYSTLVKVPEDQQREILIGQGLDADKVDMLIESIRQGK